VTAAEEGPAAKFDQALPPSPASMPQPSPEEAELAGLGTIVTIMRHMTTDERWEVVNYLSEKYGYRVDVDAATLPIDYTPRDVNDLTVELLRARRRSIELGSHALAKILLDAGWRKKGDTR
jgi:hypothetical protein